MVAIRAFLDQFGGLLWEGTQATIIMIFVSTFFAYLVGLPLGVILYLSESSTNPLIRMLNKVLGVIVNIGRSLPFIILMMWILPFTFALVKTMIGVKATLVPLTISAIPFVARIVEQSLREIPAGVIEAAKAMGSTTWQLIYKVLVPESVPSLIAGVSLTMITLVGYSAMAGMIGGGGLGDIAIRYGHYRRENTVMLVTIAIVVILVQLIQSFGHLLVRVLDKRRR